MKAQILNRKNEFARLGRWVTPTLAWEPWFAKRDSRVMEKIHVTNFSGEGLSLDGYQFYAKNDKEIMMDATHRALRAKNYKLFTDYVSSTKLEFRRFERMIPMVRKYANHSFEKLLNDFFLQFSQITPSWLTVFFAGEVVEVELLELSTKNGYDFAAVSQFVKPRYKYLITGLQDEVNQLRGKLTKKKLLRSSVASIKSQTPELYKKMAQMVKKYESIGTHQFWGSPYTMQKLMKEVREKAVKSTTLSVPKKYSKEMRQLIQIASDLSWMRIQCAEVTSLLCHELRPMLTDVAMNFGITYDDIIWLTREEIINHMREGTQPHVVDINERKQGVGLYVDDAVHAISGNDLKDALSDWVEKKATIDADHVTGAVASKGFATGRVRVLNDTRMVSEFKEGEVLVAPETTSDYLPAMKKSSAIVTNIGGITSHAAIVSRELKKPCVIGTKIATQIFKDGDIVEVDANKGVVKKI